MRIFTRKALTDYGTANAQVREELAVWYAQARLAQWQDFNAVRVGMPATEYIGNDRSVFNVKGNHHRLVAMIFFATKRLYIRGIYTHAQYSKLTKAQIINL